MARRVKNRLPIFQGGTRPRSVRRAHNVKAP